MEQVGRRDPATAGVEFDADAFNAFEAAGWDGEDRAAGYDRFFAPVTSRLVEPLLTATGVGPGMRVLDVGTGPGPVAAGAARRGASVTGVDVSPAMVALARRRHPGVDFRTASAEALPFGDGAFDVVVGNFALLHLGRPERAAAEFARVLRAGGRLGLTVWDSPDRTRLLGVFLDAVGEAGAAPPAGVPAGPPFFRFAVDGEFAGLLAGAGLTGVTVERVAFDHPVPAAGELWEGFVTGSVRNSALVLGQPEQTRRRIRAAFVRGVEAYRHGDRVELPVSVKLAVGCRAS